MSPQTIYYKRKAQDYTVKFLAWIATLFGLFFLAWILWVTFSRGFNAFGAHLFTQMTPPPGEETGGLLNALVGSLMMCLLAVFMAAPIGIAAGTYLAEYVNHSWIGEVIRFVNDILLSAPSIVLGLFIYTMVVDPMGGFSGWAGAIALGFIVLPVVVCTTDETIRLVPSQMREAALSLGIPQWKVNTQILYRAALPGILTGILLALARISGETAPLLFTALNNQYWNTDLSKPMASMPAVIFQFAMSPFEYWNQLAWAGALIVTLFVLFISIFARFVLARKKL
jgi:phosphate transport system permease protein